MLRGGYDTGGFYDESSTVARTDRGAPDALRRAGVAVATMDGRELRRAAELANRSFLHSGVTFTVYSDEDQGTERILPFDPSPHRPGRRVGCHRGGLRQRIRALNRFVHDVYHGQKILQGRHRAPPAVVLGNHFRREVVGIDVPGDYVQSRAAT